MSSGQKITQKDFLDKLKDKNIKNIKIIGKYKKYNEAVKCQCSICGYIWLPTPKSLYSGHGCPKCANNVKLTNDEFLKTLIKNNNKYDNIELLEKYSGMSKKIKCRCKICGTNWMPRAYDLIKSKYGCPSCSGNIYYTHNRFIKEFSAKNKNYTIIEILSKYNGMTNKIKCKCKICGNIWFPIASSLIQGTGCPTCAKKRVAEKRQEIFTKS